jgi:hypothetical protein
MEVLLIITIVFFVLGIAADVIGSYFKNKLAELTKKNTEILKQQNELLWAALKESNSITSELIKENLSKDGGIGNEVQKETSSNRSF